MAYIIFPNGTIAEFVTIETALGILEKGEYTFTFTRHRPGFEGIPVFTVTAVRPEWIYGK